MKTNRKHSIIKVMVLLACLELTGCVPEGGVTPRVIEGKWTLVKLRGQTYTYGDFTWEFEEDGDFTYCNDSDCFSGEWKWTKDKTELDIEFTDDSGDTYFTEFEVDILDNEILEGDWHYFSYTLDLEFERE